MKRIIVAVALLAAATPAMSQVLVGRGAPRAHRSHPAPQQQQQGLTASEEDRLVAAQDQVYNLDTQITALQTQIDAGTPLSTEQQSQWRLWQEQRQAAQAVVTALTAKQDAAH